MECEDFNITYTRIASDKPNPKSSNTTRAVSFSLENDVDQKVDCAIESFLRTLTQIGPELLSGCLTLGFFERRASRQLFGLVSHEERVVFEQWVIRVVVNNTPRPVGSDLTAVMERQRLQDTAEGMLRSALLKIFECTAGAMDHIPPVMYDFEISSTKQQVDDREKLYARVTNMPPILKLGN